MKRLACLTGALSIATILGASAMSGCGCLQLYGCGDTGQPPVQDGTTRAIFNGVSGAWKTAGLYGYVDDPRFPVAITQTQAQVSYFAIITGNQSGTVPWPINNFVVKAFGFNGPPSGSFESWYDPNQSTTSWSTDPRYPNQLVTFPFGFYIAGKDGTAQQKDKMFAQAELWYGSSSTKNLALAELTWKFSTANSLIFGSKDQMFVDEGLWIQATADLPEPITYSWAVNDAPQTWNGSYVYVIFAENGFKTITATLTGSNNVSVQKTWTVWVKCLPPAAPDADSCTTP